MCKVILCVVGRGCLLCPVHSLGKLSQSLACFILYSKAKLGCYPRCHLPSYVCIPGPYDEKNIFFWCQTVFIEPSSFILFSISGWGTDLDNCDVEWFALKMNGAPKYCISVSFIDCEDYSISSEGFFLLYR